MKTNTNIYQEITDKMIAQLEKGFIPWQKPWNNAASGACKAISHESGKPYSLLNQMLLDFRAGEWLTWKQIHAEGGRVKNGEKASTVVFWSKVPKTKKETEIDEDGNEIEIVKLAGHYMVLKSYPVFHIDQTEGITPRFNNEPVQNDAQPIEAAEAVAMNYITRDGLKFESKQSDRAYYSPSEDKVVVPTLAQYDVTEEYYSTLFHELTHSTGAAKRLNRKEVAGVSFFGDENYSREELVAEMGAAFMVNTLGLDCEKAFNNSVAYIQSWLRALKNDTKMLVIAATKAEAAVKYILNGK